MSQWKKSYKVPAIDWYNCWIVLLVTGSGGSTDVFAQHAGVGAANKGAAGIWETSIRQPVAGRGYVAVSKPCRISGMGELLSCINEPWRVGRVKDCSLAFLEWQMGYRYGRRPNVGYIHVWLLFHIDICWRDGAFQETLNYWKQLPHILKYFRENEDPTAKLPRNFMQGFLEVYPPPLSSINRRIWITLLIAIHYLGSKLSHLALLFWDSGFLYAWYV